MKLTKFLEWNVALTYDECNLYDKIKAQIEQQYDCNKLFNIETMANKNYLCKCNKCDSILFDENPNVNSIPIDVTTIEKPINHMVQLRDDSEFYWACPNCLTDSYLMDIINNDF